MSKQSVLLDTSFFIRLLNRDDALHNNAVGYFKYFLEKGYVLKISTIAIAEFCTRGQITDLPLRNMQIVPFNYDHAICAGEICAIAFRRKQAKGAIIYPRTVVPNDSKMYAQANVEDDIRHFVSADSEAFKVYRLIDEEKKLTFSFIDINIPYQVAFGELFGVEEE
ncbi:MAG: hypothetical protein IJZ86_09540 [Bacteroides sp.]|nr:hypothetical protein [Bacteroides sp.]